MLGLRMGLESGMETRIRMFYLKSSSPSGRPRKVQNTNYWAMANGPSESSSPPMLHPYAAQCIFKNIGCVGELRLVCNVLLEIQKLK